MTMRRLILLFVLCGLAPACSERSSPADDEAAVAAAATAFQTAMDTGDGATVMQYITEDALMMEGGTIENRTQYERDHLPADIEFAKSVTTTRTPIQRTIRGDVAWVRTSAEFRGAFQGKPVDILGLETMVLTREQAGWRIRALHWSSRRRN